MGKGSRLVRRGPRKEAGEVAGTGEMSEMQKLMVVLGNTVAALASNAVAAGSKKADNEEVKSEEGDFLVEMAADQ